MTQVELSSLLLAEAFLRLLTTGSEGGVGIIKEGSVAVSHKEGVMTKGNSLRAGLPL